MTRKKRKNKSRRFMNAQNCTGDNKQKRSQDPRTKRRMRNSRRDFQMARSVLLQIMINVLFLSCYFQCQLCAKKIKPATAGEFRKHLKLKHLKEKFKCKWQECTYVRTFITFSSDTLFLQETNEPYNMARHVAQHEDPDRVNCPCCESSVVRYQQYIGNEYFLAVKL